MDYKKAVKKLKRFCRTCTKLMIKFKFVSLSFIFSLNFLLFDFQEQKSNLKSFVFKILLIRDHSLTFYLCGGKV